MLAVIMLWHVGMAAGNDVYIVGYNDYGQLGLGDYLERSTQTLMRDLPLDVARSAAAGLYHNLIVGVKDGQVGTVYSWGRNTKGQLGHGNVESIKLPKQVEWKACPEPNSWVCSPALCKKDICDPSKCSKGFGRHNPYYTPADSRMLRGRQVRSYGGGREAATGAGGKLLQIG